jgi:hypothetical protein
MKKGKNPLNVNVPLFRKIQKHITEEPKRLVMSTWVKKTIHGDWNPRSYPLDLSKTPPPCGTAACIAGWAGILGPDKRFVSSVRSLTILSLPGGWSALYNPLFYTDEWPDPFRSRYLNARTAKRRAKITCERIDHLIEKGE